ncbi:MAG TPA: hypothetical protein VN258_19625 [Mobilitalea sp.]|nr:hypothetical protein [Mobilitalea sp.]
MIRVRFYLLDINYHSLVDSVMPYLTKWLSEKDNLFFDAFSKIISKDGKSSAFSRFVVSLIPNKEHLISSILTHYDELLTEYVKDLLKNNHIIAKLKGIHFEAVEGSRKDMLKVEFAIEDIDYEQTILQLIPQLMQKMAEQDGKSGKLVRLLQRYNELPQNVLMAAIGAIPKEQRDKLLAEILMEYSEELTGALNMMIAKNNIKAEISNMNMKGME